jgi:hypothetical protein
VVNRKSGARTRCRASVSLARSADSYAEFTPTTVASFRKNRVAADTHISGGRESLAGSGFAAEDDDGTQQQDAVAEPLHDDLVE